MFFTWTCMFLDLFISALKLIVTNCIDFVAVWLFLFLAKLFKWFLFFLYFYIMMVIHVHVSGLLFVFLKFHFILRLIFCLGWGIWGVTFTERVLLICTCLSSNKRAWLIILCAVLCLFSDGINLTICNLSSRQEMMNIWLDLSNNKNKLSALRTNKSNEILFTIFKILFF